MTRERLLVFNDPQALRINRDLAAEIGLANSIVFLQMEYLISISTMPEHEGRRWTRQGVQDLRDNYFSFWGTATIARIVKELEAPPLELLLIDNFNTAGYDRTQWFALNPVGVARLRSVAISQDEKSISQNEKSIRAKREMDSREVGNPIAQNEKAIGRETSKETSTEREASSPVVVDVEFAQSIEQLVKDRPEIGTLVTLLKSKVENNTGRSCRVSKRWYDSCRLLLDNDHRSTVEVHRVIEWATSDEFWRANILSFPKLREKFDTLLLQMSRSGSSSYKPETFKGNSYVGEIQ